MTGELERRRAELKQILKDAGYFNDPKPLEKLGFKLISGRTHWKLQYANVRIADKRIGYCTGCYACQKNHKCVIKDDAAAILKKMLAADVIVFGTPAYFYSCTGQLKVLFDRTVAIYPDLPNKLGLKVQSPRLSFG